MEIPGFDLYSFPSQPEVLYAIRDFEFKVSNDYFKLVVEFLIRQNCPRILIKQGTAKGPNFLIQNSADGFMKPIGSSVTKIIRKLLFEQPTGDIFQGCTDAVEDLSSVFGTMPLPAADVVARIPVVIANYVEFENRLENRRNVKRAVFELKPQKFGYVVATERGTEEMIEKLTEKINAFAP